jgi:hypothetical protein
MPIDSRHGWPSKHGNIKTLYKLMPVMAITTSLQLAVNTHTLVLSVFAAILIPAALIRVARAIA